MTDGTSSIAAAGAPPRSHRYPIARSGGLFLVLIGAGLLAGIAFSGNALVDYRVFFGGVAAATLSFFFAKRLSFGSPTWPQIAALIFALALEGALFGLTGRLLPPGTEEHVRWLWVSVIVGVHFIPMAICFGPRMLLLGAACIATAVAGLMLPSTPYEVFGVVDGMLKVVVGAWLFSTKASAA
jgi:uncharacterized protein DUF6609